MATRWYKPIDLGRLRVIVVRWNEKGVIARHGLPNYKNMTPEQRAKWPRMRAYSFGRYTIGWGVLPFGHYSIKDLYVDK